METLLDLKINTATETVKKIEPIPLTYEEKINKLLDAMNTLNGVLQTLNDLVLMLTFEIERDMQGFKQSNKAPQALAIFVKIVSKVLVNVRNSELYPGVKTTYYKIKTENNYLKELIQDREIAMQLATDNEMKAIVKATTNGKK